MCGKIQEVTVYQTTDGRRWDTIQEATEKQRVLDVVAEIENVAYSVAQERGLDTEKIDALLKELKAVYD